MQTLPRLSLFSQINCKSVLCLRRTLSYWPCETLWISIIERIWLILTLQVEWLRIILFLPQAGHPLLGYWEGFTIVFKMCDGFRLFEFYRTSWNNHMAFTNVLHFIWQPVFFCGMFHVIGPNYAEEFCKWLTSNITFMYILSCFVHLISCIRYIIMKMIDGRIFLTETR